MDKGTQEKVNPKRPWSWQGEFICKKCKKMHPFEEYDKEEFVFPNGDVSVIRIACVADGLNSRNYEEYTYEELIMPPATRVEVKLGEIEQRLSRLEEMLGKCEREKDEKPVLDRLTGLEDTVNKVAETILGGKPKQPPAGQHS